MQLPQSAPSTDDEGSADWLARTRRRYERRAQDRARREREKARSKVGALAYDALEEYFPEQAKSRQRRIGGKMLLVGLAAGILLYHIASR